MSESVTGRKRSARNVADLETRLQALILELTRTQEAFQAMTAPNRASSQPAKDEGEFGSFLESLSAGIVASDAAGRVSFVNASAQAMFGCDRTELIGQPV